MEKLWLALKPYWERYKAFSTESENTRVDRQFLPAVAELQESPASPTARILLLGLCGFIFLALIWATFGRIDIVAVGQGKIIPSGQVKVIQPLESGIVSKILVDDGQQVKKGQSLVELDLTVTEADRQRLESDLMITTANVDRLNALLNQKPLTFDDTISPSVQETQQRLYQELQGQQNAEVANLQQQLEQKQHELKGIQANISRLVQTLPLTTQRAESYQRLASKQYIAKTQAMSVEADRLNQVYELENARQQDKEASAAIQALREQIKAATANFQKTLLTDLNEKSQQQASLEQQLAMAVQKNKLQHLISPIDGYVQEMKIHTIGGVVTPAQELMKVVPYQDALEAQILIQNKDIGFVHEGQPVRLKLEAFPFTRYGLIQGNLKELSLDAIQDEKLGLVYAARVSMDKATLHVGDKDVLLTPGLAVTGEVKTGSRRIIEYFLSPILKNTSEAIRER